MIDWRMYAACQGMDTNIFMEGPTKKALAVCRTCNVTKACLDYAIRTRQWGVWGGESTFGRRSKYGVEVEEIDFTWSAGD